MNLEEIKKLVEIIENSSLDFFEISEGDCSIKLGRKKEKSAFKQASSCERYIRENEALNLNSPVLNEQKLNQPSQIQGRDSLKQLKSPMVGVYYSSPSPESEPFVSIGQKVKKGDVLCIIEAMKLMNEITSDYDGVITKALPNDGDIVQFGDLIFEIDTQ